MGITPFHTPDGGTALRGPNDQALAVRGDFRGAFRPHSLDAAQPLSNELSEAPGGICSRPQLRAEPGGGEQRYESRARFESPTLPHHPHVEIEHAWRMRESGNHLAFDRDWVLVNLSIEGLAENDGVLMGRS